MVYSGHSTLNERKVGERKKCDKLQSSYASASNPYQRKYKKGFVALVWHHLFAEPP